MLLLELEWSPRSGRNENGAFGGDPILTLEGGKLGMLFAATHDGTSRPFLRSSKCAQSFLLDLRCLFGSIGEAARMGKGSIVGNQVVDRSS